MQVRIKMEKRKAIPIKSIMARKTIKIIVNHQKKIKK